MAYAQLTREDFEKWLGVSGYPKNKWQLKPGRGGVYQLFLSPVVAIEINSTTGSRDNVLDKGKASMSLRLVSRVSGRVLNKKAQGQSYFARTTHWRTNWKKGLDRMKDAYIKAKDFYDTLAAIENYEKYQKDMIQLIKSRPHWERDSFLMSLYNKLQNGGVLSMGQRGALEKPQKAPPPPAPEKEDPRVQALRELYAKARRDKDQWTMDFAKSCGQQLQRGRPLSPKQQDILDQKARAYRVRLGSLDILMDLGSDVIAGLQ